MMDREAQPWGRCHAGFGETPQRVSTYRWRSATPWCLRERSTPRRISKSSMRSVSGDADGSSHPLHVVGGGAWS